MKKTGISPALRFLPYSAHSTLRTFTVNRFVSSRVRATTSATAASVSP